MLASGGLSLTPEATACVHTYVRTDPPGFETLTAGRTGGQEYVQRLAGACPLQAG